MDNVTINNCEHIKTILSNNGFMIAIYRAEKAVELPDGTTSRQISVKGYNLPAVEGIKYDITGKFEKYVKNNTWSLAVITIDEVQPSTADSVLAYLKTLSGVGKKRAQDLFDAFGLDVFNVIENSPERLLEIRGFKGKSVEKMLLDYAKRKTGRKLFQFLYKYRINEAKIMRLHTVLGPDSLEIIKENPFVICEILSINFRTVDSIRIDLGLPTTFKPRLKAGIYEVLQQAEFGGDLFDARNEFPSFIFDSFLPEPIYSLAFNKQELYKTSGTYIPEYVCYLMFLKLLCLPISFNDFRVLADELRNENQIYIRYENGEVRYYRWKTARAEYQAAKKVAGLMCCKSCENDIEDTFESAKEIISDEEPQESGASASNAHLEDIDRVLSLVEKKLQMKLSPEQESAVKMALSNKVSIITGGPGTGKTSVEKSIINCYRILNPDEGILLIAPTGRAAKRMSESTGAPASTIHKALGLIQNDDGDLVQTGTDSILVESLIIVDEASMIGTFLLNALLQHVSNRARVVFIGDVDQLPSIEIGAVLREMISSSVPVKRLTQTFRQASGSNIIVNAARINVGEKRLVYDDDFQLVEKDSSKEIQDAVVSEYLNLLKRYSDDEIVVLSPFRKSTETGTNSLNVRLRSVMRPDITPSTPYFERKNTRFYQGDKVMFTRNTEKLTNGDIGTITSIFKGKDGLYVNCNFNDEEIELQEEELLNLELAYAMTVHKSQGSEYKAVIMVVDNKHKVLLKRNLLYTAITRAKEKLILIGQQDAINSSIDTLDSIYRRTKLGALINGYCAEFIKDKEPTKKNEDQEQLAISF